MAIRVHLADDHTMFREGLESILASSGGGDIEVVGRSSTGGEDALALIEENKPDVVIAQIDVDLNTAREVLLRIRSSSPDSRIVVLTMFDNLHYLKALSKLGIHAYIHKSSSSKDLLATIDAASREPAGENVVDRDGLQERGGEDGLDGAVDRARGDHLGRRRRLLRRLSATIIHRSAWKGYSPKLDLRFTDLCEGRAGSGGMIH